MRIEFGPHRPAPLRAMAALATAALLGTVGFSMTSAADSPGDTSVVVPLDPERILDTRSGVGQASAGPLAAGQTIRLQVAGVGSIPADATGVVLNVTATRATAASYVAAWPSGTPQPDTSILNFSPGGDIANMITATLGTDGAINLFNSAGTVDLVADVAGYLSPSAGAGSPGPAGPAGPVGPTGPQGPTGAQGPGAFVFAQSLQFGVTQSLGTFGGFTATAECTALFLRVSFASTTPGEQVQLYGTSMHPGMGGISTFFQRQNSTSTVFFQANPSVTGDALLSRAGGEYFQVRLEGDQVAGGCTVWAQLTPATLA